MSEEELQGVVHSNMEIMGGTPVFVGTRVPLQNLIDYLEGDESVEDFLSAFPTVTREQAIAVIKAGKHFAINLFLILEDSNRAEVEAPSFKLKESDRGISNLIITGQAVDK